MTSGPRASWHGGGQSLAKRDGRGLGGQWSGIG
jgi:hypothetical protein